MSGITSKPFSYYINKLNLYKVWFCKCIIKGFPSSFVKHLTQYSQLVVDYTFDIVQSTCSRL